MMKKALLRGLIGFPIGVTIGYVISILSNLSFSPDGSYSPVVPDMAAAVGSEVGAVALQFVLTGLMGFAFAAMSVIWQTEKLNLAAQSAINFALSVITMIPIAYVCYWMEHSVAGVLSYIGIFAGIYAAIWVGLYCTYRARLRQINGKLQ